MIAQAMAGAYSLTGLLDGPPLKPAPNAGDTGTDLRTAIGILSAYIQRFKTGKGQRVERSMQESVVNLVCVGLRCSGNTTRRSMPRRWVIRWNRCSSSRSAGLYQKAWVGRPWHTMRRF